MNSTIKITCTALGILVPCFVFAHNTMPGMGPWIALLITVAVLGLASVVASIIIGIRNIRRKKRSLRIAHFILLLPQIVFCYFAVSGDPLIGFISFTVVLAQLCMMYFSFGNATGQRTG